jgi:hypothetical protein
LLDLSRQFQCDVDAVKFVGERDSPASRRLARLLASGNYYGEATMHSIKVGPVVEEKGEGS